MPYYPKNKILTNQVAIASDESSFVYVVSLKPYVGPYYKLATGEMFTGKYPGDGENSKIKIISELGSIEHATIISTTPTAPTAPTLNTTNALPLHPTPDDYKFGSFIRYFSKKRNEYLFKELTKNQYNELNSLKNPNFSLFKPFYIKWMLTGSVTTVSDFNRYSILNAEEKEQVYGLNEFLKMNYTQYYQPTV
jgi:hypothetical protein